MATAFTEKVVSVVDALLTLIAWGMIIVWGGFADYVPFGLFWGQGKLEESQVARILVLLDDNWKVVPFLAIPMLYPGLKRAQLVQLWPLKVGVRSQQPEEKPPTSAPLQLPLDSDYDG